MTDNVNHPKHYGGEDNPYETIKVLKAWMTGEELYGFLIGNVIKYVSRAKHKNGKEDLKKAQWYLNYLLENEAPNNSILSHP